MCVCGCLCIIVFLFISLVSHITLIFSTATTKHINTNEASNNVAFVSRNGGVLDIVAGNLFMKKSKFTVICKRNRIFLATRLDSYNLGFDRANIDAKHWVGFVET